MRHMRQSAVMDHTLLELSYKNNEEKLEREHPKILALLSYHMIGMETGFSSLQHLRKQSFRIQVWAEEQLYQYYKPHEILQRTDIDDMIFTPRRVMEEKHRLQYLFIPVLSFSLLNDILKYEDRHPFVALIFWALFAGVPVCALSIGADPNHVHWKKSRMDSGNTYIRHDLKGKLQEIRNLGIHLLNEDEVESWFLKEIQHKRLARVITEGDVIHAYKNQQKVIHVSDKTIVTPLAEDVAKEYKINIIDD